MRASGVEMVPLTPAPSGVQTAGRGVFDWVVAALSAVFVGGLFVDGWAHTHGRTDQSFFTPWHALFYAGFAAVAGVLAGTAVRGRQRGRSWAQALPAGYGLSLAGALVFAAGGIADMAWHALFGVEQSVEALLSPSHLVLAVGVVLIVSGPLRAAGRRPAVGWAARLPATLSLTAAFSVLTFFTMYAHLLVYPAPAANYPHKDSEAWGVTALLLQAALLAGLALLAARTSILPAAGLTIVLGLNAAAMSVLHESPGYRVLPVLAAVAAGMLADVLRWALAPDPTRPGGLRLFGLAVPTVYYAGYFGAIALGDGLAWSVHLWTGAIALAAITGWLASYLAVPPSSLAPAASPES